jgi:hypothetical protein
MTVAEAFPPPVLMVDDVRPDAPVVVQGPASAAPPRSTPEGPSWDGVEYPPDEEHPAAAAPAGPVVWPVVAQPGGRDE